MSLPLDVIGIIMYKSNIQTVGNFLSTCKEINKIINIDWNTYFKLHCNQDIYDIIIYDMNIDFIKTKGKYMIDIEDPFFITQWLQYLPNLYWVDKYILKSTKSKIIIYLNSNSQIYKFIRKKYRLQGTFAYICLSGDINDDEWRCHYEDIIFEYIPISSSIIKFIYYTFSKEIIIDLIIDNIHIEDISKNVWFIDN